ncbi:hypothetical protein V8G54_023303 [Vigna mungo]|uniref:Uncharacterized protein n=1 Tax=Vigna mungo TaxID=3915 RepID=A0AAQ3N4U9_VIGMU
MGGRNIVLVDAVSCRITFLSDIPTIKFGENVTHPENGEESSPSIPVAHRQEHIQDLYKMWHDLVCGLVSGGMIRTSKRVKVILEDGVNSTLWTTFRAIMKQGLKSSLDIQTKWKVCAMCHASIGEDLLFKRSGEDLLLVVATWHSRNG